jgi:hypothetical protein
MSNFMNVRSLGDELFQAGRRAGGQAGRRTDKDDENFRTHLKVFVSELCELIDS